MSLAEKKKRKNTNVPVNKNMHDYSGEAVFIEKKEKAAEIIKKYGLPKTLLKRVK